VNKFFGRVDDTFCVGNVSAKSVHLCGGTGVRASHRLGAAKRTGGLPIEPRGLSGAGPVLRGSARTANRTSGLLIG
jgi:hypothetical protein